MRKYLYIFQNVLQFKLSMLYFQKMQPWIRIIVGPESDEEHWAIGWGRTRNGRGQGDRNQGGAFINILQKLKLPIVPYEKCRTWGEDQGIKTSPFSTLAVDRYLCAGGRKRKNKELATYIERTLMIHPIPNIQSIITLNSKFQERTHVLEIVEVH